MNGVVKGLLIKVSRHARTRLKFFFISLAIANHRATQMALCPYRTKAPDENPTAKVRAMYSGLRPSRERRDFMIERYMVRMAFLNCFFMLGKLYSARDFFATPWAIFNGKKL